MTERASNVCKEQGERNEEEEIASDKWLWQDRSWNIGGAEGRALW